MIDDDDRALANMAHLLGPEFVRDAEAGFIPEFKRDRQYLPKDFEPFLGTQGSKTLAPLPNAVRIDPLSFLNTLASSGSSMTPVWGYALMADCARNQWTQFFLTSWMLSGLDGGGFAVTYDHPQAVVRQFAICVHEVEDHPGVNHSRGWHPGHCKKCGFNMTYDSGD